MGNENDNLAPVENQNDSAILPDQPSTTSQELIDSKKIEPENSVKSATGLTESVPVSIEQQAAVLDEERKSKPFDETVLEPEKLPEDASKQDKEYALKMRRYLTKRTQEISDQMRRLEEYDKIARTEDWKDYLKWRETRNVQSPQRNVEEQFNWDEAYSDPKKIQQYIETRIQQEKQSLNQQFSNIQREQARMNARAQIEDFAQLHSDFWDYYDMGIAQPVIREYVDVQGKSLEEAYQQMRKIAESAANRYQKNVQSRIQQKKQAVSQAPTSAVNNKIIWVNNHTEARKMALDLVMKGSDQVVRVKPKPAKNN